MKRWLPACVILLPALAGAEPPLEVGFGETDLTPKLGDKPVFMAGFGQNRKATGVHDPLKARAWVLRRGKEKLALVSVDLVGFFRPNVLHVRAALPGFSYVLVNSTHNHEGPDILGLWGPTPLQSGVDPAYLGKVEKQVARAVRKAEKACVPAKARIGQASAGHLLRDSREPYIKHEELVVLDFANARGKRVGLVVQWNCHPETLGGKNTEISADYVGPLVRRLREKYSCPVVYFTGTVGGLMTSLGVEVKSAGGKRLEDGTFEKTERLGELLSEVASRAVKDAKPLDLTPWEVRSREVFLPMDNRLFELARRLGVLRRDAYLWAGDPYRAKKADPAEAKKRIATRTEVGWLRLGQLEVAAISGEIYPELVLGKVQDPPDPGADFPKAPVEPAIYAQMRGPHRMILGLANDEIGYIIPRRQWDEKPPFCYGRKKKQYGEVNSLGPQTAPLLCEAFRDLVKGKGKK
jgi:hypothetical protein